MNLNNLKKLKGDASNREFYRNKINKSIVVFSNNEKYKNILVYEAINRLLLSKNIYTPKLIKKNYYKNFIEIEDLGNQTGLKKFKKFETKNYKKLFKILIKLEKIKNRKVKTFLNTIYKIPIYSNKLLLSESMLFTQWYLPTKIKTNSKKISLKFNMLLKKLIKKLKLKNKVLVHRDFHISNIIIYKKKIYLIDNQDAVYGNQAYDLASLIDDVRIKISLNKREKLYDQYILNKNINKIEFRNDFEILSVLRNLKIIGIFTRLSIRDKKHSYLKMIPYAWKMINERRKDNSHFKELNNFLVKYFPKQIIHKK